MVNQIGGSTTAIQLIRERHVKLVPVDYDEAAGYIYAWWSTLEEARRRRHWTRRWPFRCDRWVLKVGMTARQTPIQRIAQQQGDDAANFSPIRAQVVLETSDTLARGYELALQNRLFKLGLWIYAGESVEHFYSNPRELAALVSRISDEEARSFIGASWPPDRAHRLPPGVSFPEQEAS